MGSVKSGHANPEQSERKLLDQLLEESRLYRTGKDYQELLEFVVQLRNFAPFNALLLQIQKPGLSYAASARDWRKRFKRTIKEGARPLVILWPFGPVAFVYDVLDTEGEPLPRDVETFPAEGAMSSERLNHFCERLEKKHIHCIMVDAGDAKAGQIRVVRPKKKDEPVQYFLQLNSNHSAPVRFVTLAHELAHLFLGHLGEDKVLKAPKRVGLSHAQRELEAESVAYLVCRRNGVHPKSETYLSGFVKGETKDSNLDIYQIMRAAGQVESILGLDDHSIDFKLPPALRQGQLFDGLNS